jgi:hypothetical protein
MKEEFIIRRMPSYMSILNIKSIDESISMCIIGYKEWGSKTGNRGANFVDFENKKYKDNFLKVVTNICKIIYGMDKNIKMANYKFAKICSDYFMALDLEYKKMGRKFFITQVGTPFATECFLNYIYTEHGSHDKYLELLNPERKYLKNSEENSVIKEVVLEENNIKFKNVKGIKGMSEIVFE